LAKAVNASVTIKSNADSINKRFLDILHFGILCVCLST
jgi:hypothetical protein